MSVFRKLTDEEQQKLGLANLDVLLSTRASEVTLLSVLDQVAKDNTLEQIVEALSLLSTSNSNDSTVVKESVDSSSQVIATHLRMIIELQKEQNNLLKLILS